MIRDAMRFNIEKLKQIGLLLERDHEFLAKIINVSSKGMQLSIEGETPDIGNQLEFLYGDQKFTVQVIWMAKSKDSSLIGVQVEPETLPFIPVI